MPAAVGIDAAPICCPLEDEAMIVQTNNEMPQSLWRKQADRWLNLSYSDAPTGSYEQADKDDDPDPPPAAPAMRPWPRVFPGL